MDSLFRFHRQLFKLVSSKCPHTQQCRYLLDIEARDQGCLDQHLLNRTLEKLHHMSYSEQIEFKQNLAGQYLQHFVNVANSCNIGKPTQEFKNYAKTHNNFACPLEEIIPSPVINGYRNKDKFTIGTSVYGQPKSVGFKVSSRLFKDEPRIANAVCRMHKESHIEMSKILQEFVQGSKLDIFRGFKDADNPGFWRLFLVRSNQAGKLLVSAIGHPKHVNQDDIKLGKDEFREFFEIGPGKLLRPESTFFHVCRSSSSLTEGNGPISHIAGQKYLHETLLGLQFRISPDSFWQVNTRGAEVLYQIVKRCANLDDKTVLLDICCGTGTIGITLAKHVQKVIGLEVLPSAVEDANLNAVRNGITNIEFVCGKAESELKHFVDKFTAENTVVAILNPGRGGFNAKVTRALRRFEPLKKVIYISCKPYGRPTFNFVGLCQAEDDKHPGKPFLPTNAIPMDMFPHTRHFELIMVFER